MVTPLCIKMLDKSLTLLSANSTCCVLLLQLLSWVASLFLPAKSPNVMLKPTLLASYLKNI